MNDDWTTGRELFQAEKYEEAIPYLERAARSAEDADTVRGPALSHLGIAQFALERFEDSVATFRAAILQMPGKARLHFNLGNSLFALGRLAEAKRQYELALDIDPQYEEAQQALVVLAAEAQAAQQQQAAAPPHQSLPLLAEPTAPAGLPAVTDTASPKLIRLHQSVEQIELKLRAAREAARDARYLLTQREKAEQDLVEELLNTLHALQAEQDTAIREAGVRFAQDLLRDAASRLI
jgi:tetratricopeptide (TPR) repeat protein